MPEPLNILVIEDSNADFLLSERHLKQHGLSALCRRVDTLKGLKEAICGEKWDLVLADYNVPHLDFQLSLDLLQTEMTDVPIIMVTGSLGEEKAVELLKLGVSDFVLKGSLARLVPAIERSIRDTSDLNDKRAAEEELRECNKRFRMIYEHSIDAILLARTDGSIIAANPEACRVFGMTESGIISAGRDGLVDTADAQFIALLEERGRTGQFRGEITMKRGDGSRFPAETSSAVFTECDGIQKISMIIRDITERKRLEEQNRQAQKMGAVGLLAGGVAHDFNNILSAIYGYSYLIMTQAKDNEVVLKYVDGIMKASERAAVLTRSLLTLSRKQAVTLAVIELTDVIKGNEAFLLRLIREDIELKITCSGEPLTVMADRGQIEQVIMNLVINARDAMPNGGKLSVEAVPATLDQAFIDTQGYGKAGAYASFSVSDNGVGMSKETQSRIFEPLFTTKEQGKGTGLGLSMACSIIKNHNGFINVYSEPGTGTTFKFYLPTVHSSEQVGKTEKSEVAPLRGRTGTILLCEDDADLLWLSKELLKHYGYFVIEAVNGQDAVDKFVEYGESINLVILDAIMPIKNGREVCKEMRLVRPDLKVIYVSGHARDLCEEGKSPDVNTMFIQKPVSPGELITKVRDLLDMK